MQAHPLVVDDEIREILEFIKLHRILYGIEAGTPQPSGLGEAWGTLKQRVYGTLAYEREFGPSWAIELNDAAQKAETLAYIRTKRADLIARLAAEVDRLRRSLATKVA